MYGPITLGLAVPVTLYKAGSWTTDPWGYPDESYNYADHNLIDFSLDSSNGVTRTLVLKKHSGATIPAGRYTIRPITGGLLCAGVAGTPPSVYDFQYSFILEDDWNPNGNYDQYCGSADFNCDGDVGTDADINAFFACLSGSCPSAPCASSVDFNGDGDVGTDADLEAFFRILWGGHC